MSNFSYREYLQKAERLKDLQEENFNIPRFYFLDQNSNIEEFNKAISWAENIHNSSPEQIFNIRTYQYKKVREIEISSCPHKTDILFNNLFQILSTLNKSYITMIDAETPDNGLIAGTILTSSSKPSVTEFEFVVKPIRAMVRDINSSKDVIRLSVSSLTEIERDFYYSPEEVIILEFLYKKVNSFYKKNIIFEFTYFNSPSGILFQSNIFPESSVVFWEYRGY